MNQEHKSIEDLRQQLRNQSPETDSLSILNKVVEVFDLPRELVFENMYRREATDLLREVMQLNRDAVVTCSMVNSRTRSVEIERDGYKGRTYTHITKATARRLERILRCEGWLAYYEHYQSGYSEYGPDECADLIFKYEHFTELGVIYDFSINPSS